MVPATAVLERMLRGTVTLFRIRGIPVRAHWSLLLILVYLAFAFATQLASPAQVTLEARSRLTLPLALLGLILAVGLFASVLLHELAHSLVAVRFGGRVRGITLMMLGGVSQLEGMPSRPGIEALVAIVGPLCSGALAGVLLLLHAVSAGAPVELQLALYHLGWANLALGLFNLLPAFPLDGGRALRALLAARMGVARATRIAAWIGRAGAGALALLGLLGGNLLLLFIGLFLFLGAGAELAVQLAREALTGLRVRDLTIARPAVAGLEATLAGALALMRDAGRGELIAIGDAGDALGVVRAEDIARIPGPLRATTSLREVRERLVSPVATVSLDAPATSLLDSAVATFLVVQPEASGAAPTVVGLIGPAELVAAVRLARIDRSGPGHPHPTSA